ncbi:TPA: hypothetical protein KEY88_005317 [Serratia marcescens]|nr:hypothetical protein [Serratia marcescens]
MPPKGKNAGDVDIGDVIPENAVSVDEGDRLRFAKQILLCIFLTCLAVFAAHAYWDKNEALTQIFEFLKIGALPLITLVISFYFPNSATKA